MLAVPLFMFAVAAVIVGCAAAVVALNVAIIVDAFKALGKRSWRLACGLVLISVVAGVIWSECRSRMEATLFAILLLSLLPVLKFCICWHRNSMPKNRYYVTTLKMSFLPCSLLLFFAAFMLYGEFMSPKPGIKGPTWAHATFP